MKPLYIKQKAIKYRKEGYSYNMISEKLGLAKATLSNWLKEISYKPNEEVRKRIKLSQLMAGQANHNKRIADIEKMNNLAKKELGKLTKRDLWLLGIGVYIGEGSKSHESTEIANSDPKTVKMAMKWFHKICGLKKENFTPAVHLYPDNNIRKSIKYWSKITGIPENQFRKTQIDKRTNKSSGKRGKLPYGTLYIRVKSCGKKEFGRSLYRRIMGWIETTSNQI